MISNSHFLPIIIKSLGDDAVAPVLEVPIRKRYRDLVQREAVDISGALTVILTVTLPGTLTSGHDWPMVIRSISGALTVILTATRPGTLTIGHG